MSKKYLVMVPTAIQYSVVEVDMTDASEEQAWTLGTESVMAHKQLETFEIDLVGATGGGKKIAQDLLKIGSVYQGQERQKAREWAQSMKANGHF